MGLPMGLPVVEAPNGGWNWLLGLFTLTLTVPIAELLIVYLHLHIPVVVFCNIILTLGLIATGQIGAFWNSSLAKPWMITVVLFIIAAVLSEFPRRSGPYILEYALRFHVFPFYCCAIATTTKKVRHVFSWVGWGAFIMLFLCLMFGQLRDGRLVIPDTDMNNPNDLGLGVMFAMTGLVVLKSRISRILIFLTLPVFIMEILKTGSRACFVTLVAVVAISFFMASKRTRLILVIATPVAAVAALTVIPSFTLSRLTLIVSDPTRAQVSEQLKGAVDSQEARAELQKRAIELTVRHPVFGVGALMFQDAVEGMVHDLTGKKSGWQGAHNTYLEVAAEDGIPAMLFYTWSVLLCLVTNYRAYKMCRENPAVNEAATQSFGLILMTVTFAICTFFNNNAYYPGVCVLVGLTAANYLAVERERKALPGKLVGLQSAVRKPVAPRSPHFRPAPVN
jgi:hypothetical protein